MNPRLFIIAGCNGAGKTTASFSLLPEVLDLLVEAMNYHLTLIFFWLESVEMAIERVKKRVEEGGHNIETDVIRRRYKRGVQNLFEIYLPLVSEALVYDNSHGKPDLVASIEFNGSTQVKNAEQWEKLKKQSR